MCVEVVGEDDSVPEFGYECWREWDGVVWGQLEAGESAAEDSDIQLRDMGSSPLRTPPLALERRFFACVRSDAHTSGCANRCARRAA